MKNNSQKPPKGALVGMGMMLAMVPLEVVLDKLQDALTAYKLAPNKETKQEFVAAMTAMAMKFDTEGKDPFQIMQEFSKMESEKEMLDNLSGNGPNLN